MEMKQQSFLRSAMGKLNVSRAEFAQKFGISKRTIDAWLLPDTSKGFRSINPNFQWRVLQMLRDCDIETSYAFDEGEVSNAVATMHCDIFDFDFPTIFRVTTEFSVEDAKENTKDGKASFKEIYYTLSSKPHLNISNGRIIKCEPIDVMDKKKDKGWIFVREHSSLDRMEAYISAIFESMPDVVCHSLRLCKMNGRIFTIYHSKNPFFGKSEYKNIKNNVIKYSSDVYLEQTPDHLKKIFGPIRKNNWEVLIDENGRVEDDMYGEYK